MIDFTSLTVRETRDTGEPGEIISEIMNVRHRDMDGVNLRNLL